jgi:hypothetical protein
MELNNKIVKLKLKEQELLEQLAYWDAYPPVNNMGKWARQVKLDRLQERLKKVQEKIHFHDSIYLSNEIYNEWKKDVK